jgi:hypothetical protein
MIERLQRVGDVFAIPLEDDFDRLLRVNIEHGDGAIFRARRIRHRDEKRKHREYKPKRLQAQGHATFY